METLMHRSIDFTWLKPTLFGLMRLRRRLRSQGLTSVAIDCGGVRAPSFDVLRGFRLLAVASEKEHCVTSLVNVEPEFLVLLDLCRLSPSFEIHPRVALHPREAREPRGPVACDSVSVEAKCAA